MSTHPDNSTRPLLSTQVRNAILSTMETHLPLGIQGRNLDDEKLWDILMYASVNGTTIESACNELADTPSGNTVREHLGRVLAPTREQVSVLEEQLTAALQSQLPKGLFRRLDRRAYETGFDLTEIPYHGQPATDLPDAGRCRRDPSGQGQVRHYPFPRLCHSGRGPSPEAL